jgi:cyanobactin maturation PatA/PatG family protease
VPPSSVSQRPPSPLPPPPPFPPSTLGLNVQPDSYLPAHLDEARSLIWTLNLELTPVYAIESVGPYGSNVDAALVEMLAGQSLPRDNPQYVERVSIPALLTDRTIRLFSGQVLPIIQVDGTRGMYSWRTAELIKAAIAAAVGQAGYGPNNPPPLGWENNIENTLRQILNKIYYQYRNLGLTSPDRALNFAATNLFQLASVLASTLGAVNVENQPRPRNLASIDVVKSPYCRVDSDCWDVQLKFFDPTNTNVAFDVFRFTLDVSDKLPVSLGDIVDWSSVG